MRPASRVCAQPEVGTKKRPRPGTPRSGLFLLLAGLGSFLDPLTCEQLSTRSLHPLPRGPRFGRPSAEGLQRRPATSPPANQVPRPDWLPSLRRPVRWLTFLICQRMTNATVHSGRIRNARTVFNNPPERSRFICISRSKNLFYGVTLLFTVIYEIVNRCLILDFSRVVNK